MIFVPKKPLFLVLPYFELFSLQIRTKFRKSLKDILNYCKLQILFKSQNKLSIALCFKDHITKQISSDTVYKFLCGFSKESFYDCVKHLNIRTSKGIHISRLTKKKIKPKGSAASDHFSLSSNSPSFDSFNELANKNRKNLLELKKSPLIMRDKQLLNKNIRSAL